MKIKTNNQSHYAFWLQKKCEMCDQEITNVYNHLREKHGVTANPRSCHEKDVLLKYDYEIEDDLYDPKDLTFLQEIFFDFLEDV